LSTRLASSWPEEPVPWWLCHLLPAADSLHTLHVISRTFPPSPTPYFANKFCHMKISTNPTIKAPELQIHLIRSPPPIQRLPSELLLKIFFIWRNDTMDIRHWSRCRNTEWLTATWICCFWRQITLSCATFWNQISITRQDRTPGFFEEYVRRSANASLYMSIWEIESGSRISLLITQQLPRLKELTIYHPAFNLFSKSLRCLASPAPALTYLALNGVHYSLQRDHYCPPSNLFDNSAPTLQEADIIHLPLYLFKSILKTVTRLSLNCLPYREGIQEIIDCLETLSQLEELDIRVNRRHGNSNTTHNLPITSFQNLVRIVVRGDPKACYELLQASSFPKIRIFQLKFNDFGDFLTNSIWFYSEFLPVVQRHWCIFLGQGDSTLHAYLSASPQDSMHHSSQEYSLQAHHQGDCNRAFQLSFPFGNHSQPDGSLTLLNIMIGVCLSDPRSRTALNLLKIGSAGLAAIDNRSSDGLRRLWLMLVTRCTCVRSLHLSDLNASLGSILFGTSADLVPFPQVTELFVDLSTEEECGSHIARWLTRRVAVHPLPVKLIAVRAQGHGPFVTLVDRDNVVNYPFS
jgi:hypothetical protein